MWSAHSYYMVEVMLVRYVNINAHCRASGVLVPLACFVGGITLRLSFPLVVLLLPTSLRPFRSRSDGTLVGALLCDVDQVAQLPLAGGHVAQGECAQRHTAPAHVLLARAVVCLV